MVREAEHLADLVEVRCAKGLGKRGHPLREVLPLAWVRQDAMLSHCNAWRLDFCVQLRAFLVKLTAKVAQAVGKAAVFSLR